MIHCVTYFPFALDINECSDGPGATDTDNCHDNATCANSDGSYDCECDRGYAGDGFSCTGKLINNSN